MAIRKTLFLVAIALLVVPLVIVIRNHERNKPQIDSMMRILNIGIALNKYRDVHHRWPQTSAITGAEVIFLIQPFSDHKLQSTDAFGYPIRIDLSTAQKVIWSAGCDGTFQDKLPAQFTETHSCDADIVMVGDAFVQQPAGIIID